MNQGRAEVDEVELYLIYHHHELVHAALQLLEVCSKNFTAALPIHLVSPREHEEGEVRLTCPMVL